MEMKKISKKGMEMTMPLLVSIVIGLVLLAIILYIVWSRSQTFSVATGCDESNCVFLGHSCTQSGYEPGFVACKKAGTDGKMQAGRCCVPMESG